MKYTLLKCLWLDFTVHKTVKVFSKLHTVRTSSTMHHFEPIFWPHKGHIHANGMNVPLIPSIIKPIFFPIVTMAEEKCFVGCWTETLQPRKSNATDKISCFRLNHKTRQFFFPSCFGFVSQYSPFSAAAPFKGIPHAFKLPGILEGGWCCHGYLCSCTFLLHAVREAALQHDLVLAL